MLQVGRRPQLSAAVLSLPGPAPEKGSSVFPRLAPSRRRRGPQYFRVPFRTCSVMDGNDDGDALLMLVSGWYCNDNNDDCDNDGDDDAGNG